MGSFGGLDVSDWVPNTCWLWRYSNLRFVGFYLNHLEHPHHGGSNWNGHLYDLRDTGWNILPLWLPFAYDQILALMPVTDGAADGRIAAVAAGAAGFERGATIYLDVEAQIFKGGLRDAHGQLTGQARYLVNWLRAVRTAGFGVGIYCSWLDAKPESLLSTSLRDYSPVLWPFATLLSPRATWDQEHFELDPALPSEWPVSAAGEPPPADQNWPANGLVIGCQYDQDQRHNALIWPQQNGKPNGSRSVDWDSSKVPDPAHPSATGVVTYAATWGNPDFLDVFVVHPEGIDTTSRNRSAALRIGMNLVFGPRDIGPTPSAREDAFDHCAAAVSRDAGVTNLFVLGLDGRLRTLFADRRESYPRHGWALNPGSSNEARRASPLAAVARARRQIDVFYVDRAHRLVTQWLGPTGSDRATDWQAPTARRVLAGPLVAGGSNLAVLPSPSDYANTADSIPNRLDVFYVSFDYTDPTHPDAWRVVHAEWSPTADWLIAPIPGLIGVAAASGVAATRDPNGTVHVVVQLRTRTSTHHARLPPAGNWSVSSGPQPPPPAGSAPGAADAWVSLHLAGLRDAVVLAGMTRLGQLAWNSWTVSGGWAATSTAPSTLDASGYPRTQFSTGGRLQLARRGPSDLDILGVTETGQLASRTLHVTSAGDAVLATP